MIKEETRDFIDELVNPLQNKYNNDIIMNAMASKVISLAIVYSRRRSKNTSKLRVTSLCEGNSPLNGEFPAQRAGNEEKVSI